MAEIEHVVLLHDRRGWSVKVVLREGGWRRYRYGSEAQARFFRGRVPDGASGAASHGSRRRSQAVAAFFYPCGQVSERLRTFVGEMTP